MIQHYIFISFVAFILWNLSKYVFLNAKLSRPKANTKVAVRSLYTLLVVTICIVMYVTLSLYTFETFVRTKPIVFLSVDSKTTDKSSFPRGNKNLGCFSNFCFELRLFFFAQNFSSPSIALRGLSQKTTTKNRRLQNGKVALTNRSKCSDISRLFHDILKPVLIVKKNPEYVLLKKA